MIRLILFLSLMAFNSISNGQDVCSGAYDEGELGCGDTITGSGDAGTTSDAEAINCMTGLNGTWYTFTTATSLLELTISGGDYNLFEGTCAGLNPVVDCSGSVTIAADASTTYYVLVAEGDNFTVTAPAIPSNDDCSGATDTGASDISGENNNCASTDDGICGSDGNASVWYSYDIDLDLESFTINLVSQGITSPVMALYSSCGSQIQEECGNDMVVECLAAGSYFLQVASDFNNTGDFDINFTEMLSGVSNDDCGGAIDITPSVTCESENVSGDSSGACPESSDFGSGCEINMQPTVWFEFSTSSSATSMDFTDLSSNLELAILDACGGSSVAGCVSGDTNVSISGGTTYLIAATLTSGGGSFDFDITMNEPPENDVCGDATPIASGDGFNTCCGSIEGVDDCGGSETGVWIIYDMIDGDGSEFEFSNIDMTGNIGIEIYSGSCGSLELLNEPYCGGPGNYTFETANCGAQQMWVHVTSSEGGCGSFDLSVTPGVACPFGEDCEDGPTLSPTTGSAAVCVTGCNTYACDSDCGSNGVWFLVETDDLATEMAVIVSNAGPDIDPIISIHQVDCGNVLLGCAGVSSGDITEVAVSGNLVYLIEVSSGGGGTPGDFEICVLTDESEVECSSGEIEPTRPEYPDADPDGPYCPGEVVNFCYDVTFIVDPFGQGNNCQWIQGIIPTIGGGWDLESMPLDIQGPGGSWFWLDEGEVVYNAASSALGTIDTPNGLGLEFGLGTLSAGDDLPGGWWSTSSGGGGCANDGNPNTMWGLPASCGSTQDVSFCFDLMVGTLDDISQCGDMDFTDLKVHMFTMADGQTGCWSNNSCSGDTPVTFNAVLDCTSLVFILAEDVEICHDEVLNIPVETEDGSSIDIIVEVIEEGNTSGAMDHIFPGPMGVIADQITNEGDDVEVVIYEAYGLDPNSICEGPRTTIEVVVYPEILIEGEDPYYLCYESPREVTPFVTGGNGGPYTYMWEDGSDDSSIELPLNPGQFPGEYEIIVMVTDGLGCSAEMALEYVIVEPLVPEIINPYIGVCKDGIEDLPELFLEFESVGTGPYEFNWEANPGGLRFENGNDEQNLIINEEESSARTYTIFGTVIDEYGCEYTVETELIVDNGPDLQFEVDECFGTVFSIVGYDNDGLLVTFELFYDEDNDWLFDGTTILNAVSVASTFGDNITYLAEKYGTYLLVGTSENGCIDFAELELPPVPLPQFEVFPNDTVCQGTQVTINLANADDYVNLEWSNGQSSDTIRVMPNTTKTYYLVAETREDCIVTDSIKIVVNPLPIINVTGSTSICPGSQTVLEASGNPNNSYLWTGPNGEIITTQSAIISAIGDWMVEVVSLAGCINSTVVTVDENAQLNPNISGENLCVGSSVILNGGPGFDSYEWSDSNGVIGSAQTVEVSQGGDYFLNVVLGSGPEACNGTDEFTVVAFDPLPVALSDNGFSVCNINTGSLETSLDLTSFETGVSGEWFNQNNLLVINPSNIDFAGAAPGIYNYTFITNEAQFPCTDDPYNFGISVTDCSCPSVAINAPPDFCNEASAFNLNLIKVTSEVGTWSVSPSGMEIINNMLTATDQTPPGDYNLTFTLTDTNHPPSCALDSTIVFTVFAAPTAELVKDATVCNEDTGNGPDFIDLDDLFLSGTPGEWSTNVSGLVIDSDNVVNFAGKALGKYRFFYYMEDLNSPCDPVTIPIDIVVENCSCPELALSTLPSLCNSGGTFNLNTFLSNPQNESGFWSVSGPDATVLLSSTVVAAGRIPGEYEFTFTFNNTFGGSCINSVSGIMNVFSPPVAIVETMNFACNGTSITVYPTVLDLTSFVSGAAGTWQAPASFNNGVIDDETAVDFLNVDPGSYTFIYTTTTADTPCNNVNYQMQVDVRNCNCPFVNFIPPTPVCNDGPPVDLNSYIPPNSPEGVWSFINGSPAVTINNGSFVNISILDGFYLFQYTLDEVPTGCPDFGQISLEVVSPPEVIHIPSAEVCNVASINGPLCLDLSEFLQGAPGDWAIPANFSGDASDITNICFDAENVGEMFSFVFNTTNGSVTCDERNYTTQVLVKDCACPNLSILQGPEICNLNGSLDLNSLVSANIEPGFWTVVDGPASIEIINNRIDLTDAEEGIYTIEYAPNLQPSADCIQFSQTSFEVIHYPSVGTAAFSDLCISDGEVISLDDMLNDADSGGQWNSLNNAPGFNFVDNTFEANGLEPGEYEFEYRFTNIAPCPNTNVVISLFVAPLIDAEIEDSPCANANDGAIIVASIGSGNNYLYSLDGGLSWTQNTEFNNLPPGSYTLMIQDENGCQSTLPNIVVSEPGPFSVNTGEDREIDASNEFVTLELATSVDVSQIATIVWTEDGTVICSGGVDQCLIIAVDPDGVSQYCATVTDINGCISEDCVFIRERVVKDVYISNVMDIGSSSGDAIFFVQADEFVESISEFLIFDRWGEMVFLAEPNHAPNDRSKGWNGTFNNQNVEQGVYVYVIKVKFTDGTEEIFVGDLTVFR